MGGKRKEKGKEENGKGREGERRGVKEGSRGEGISRINVKLLPTRLKEDVIDFLAVE